MKLNLYPSLIIVITIDYKQHVYLSHSSQSAGILTEDVEDDEPLEDRRGRPPLPLSHQMVLRAAAAYVGGGENQQEEEHAERGTVVHELHEWGAQELPDPAAREDQVVRGHDRHQADETDDDEELRCYVTLAPAGQTVVPDGG